MRSPGLLEAEAFFTHPGVRHFRGVRVESYAKEVERSKFPRDLFGKLEPVKITPDKIEEYVKEPLNKEN